MSSQSATVGPKAPQAKPRSSGITPFGELRQHKYKVRAVAWSPDGRTLATGSEDETVGFFDLAAGGFHSVITSYYSEVNSVEWAPDGQTVLATTLDGEVHLIDPKARTGRMLLETEGGIFPRACWLKDGRHFLTFDRNGGVSFWTVGGKRPDEMFRLRLPNVRHGAVSPDYSVLALATTDGQIALYDIARRAEYGRLAGRGKVLSVHWAPRDGTLLAAMEDTTVRVWNVRRRRQDTVLEGHLKPVISMAFSRDMRLLATQDVTGVVQLWRTDTWHIVGKIDRAQPGGSECLSFHPRAPILASTGAKSTSVRIWRLDYKVLIKDLPERETDSITTYRNAKVVLVGDSGVGKSGLGLRLLGKDFAATESTHGRYVHTFDQKTVAAKGGKELREALLWDLAGQPGYRLIHQLHLDEVAVALVVFDCKSPVDPFAGVSHWDRALETARQGSGGEIPLIKFMVAGRVDRGAIAASSDAIKQKMERHGFSQYFETSAREGWGLDELRKAIQAAVQWDALPRVSSTQTFQSIKTFLVAQGQKGRLLLSVEDLYNVYARTVAKTKAGNEFRQEFQACVRLLESRDVVRRLSFGDLVLLKPEYLDAYASSIVEAATASADGLGRIAQDAVLGVKFRMSDSERIADRAQERLLLMATVEDLLRRELALREFVDGAYQLILPSQITREKSGLAEGRERFCVFEFDGPVMSVYATLVVRLSQSGMFTSYDMWRNGAEFLDENGLCAGIVVAEPEEGLGEFTLLVERGFDPKLRGQFEMFVEKHLSRWVSSDHVRRREIVSCPDCGTMQPEDHVRRRLEAGRDYITCGVCDSQVPLRAGADGTVQEVSDRDVAVIERRADATRDREAGITAALAETTTTRFEEWAGGDRATVAIVFTDVVGSTRLYEELGDEKMDEVRQLHFDTGRSLVTKHNGYEIKTMGDAFMVAFKAAVPAFDFMVDLHGNTGHELIRIRAVADVGSVRIRENDAFGGTVNYAARLQGLAKGAELWVSQKIKQEIDYEKADRHAVLPWKHHRVVAGDKVLKGFKGEHDVWQVVMEAE
jgi:small GTP-binding protein